MKVTTRRAFNRPAKPVIRREYGRRSAYLLSALARLVVTATQAFKAADHAL